MRFAVCAFRLEAGEPQISLGAHRFTRTLCMLRILFKAAKCFQLAF